MLNKSKISYKIFLTVSSAFFLLFLLSGWASYSLVNNILTARQDELFQKTVHNIRETIETSARLANRAYIRATAEHCLEIVQGKYALANNGTLTAEKAREEAMELISAQKIGPSGYVYILNSEGILQLHPVAQLTKTDISDFEFVKKQIAQKDGFLQYQWQNPHEKMPRQKILFMKYFEPWDWIISVSSYVDELSELVDSVDFLSMVSSIMIADNGYVIIMQSDGKILLHPGLDDYNFDDDDTLSKLKTAVTEASNGKKTFLWKDPLNGKIKEKILFYESSEMMGWVVAATGFAEEFHRPITLFKRLQLTLIFAFFILSLFISYYLSRTITSPLKSLLLQVSQKSNFEGNRSLPPSCNEIEELSHYFSDYVQQIENRNDKLKNLLKRQEEITRDLNIYKKVFENIAEGIIITDASGIILRVNSAFEGITGYSAEEALGRNPRMLKSGTHDETFYAQMWGKIFRDGFWTGKIWNKRKNNEVYPEYLTISAVRNQNGEISHFSAVFIDISETVEQEERIRFLAYHDHLTHLPNRLQINSTLDQFISECRLKNEQMACIICDIDNFKNINDSLGQENGDELLKQFVERMRGLIRTEDSFGRIHGDEFVLLAKYEHSSVEQTTAMIERFFSAFNTPLKIGEKDIYITLSFGMATFPNDSHDGETLLKRALLAKNNAIHQKGNSYRFYDAEMEHVVIRKINYLLKIREGIKNSEFLPYYQPKVNLSSGEVIGMEALARWKAKDGLVSPADFIPVAEESGLIIDMSQQLYEKAFTDTMQLAEQGYNLKLSINISPVQLHSPDFLQSFLQIQKNSGLPPEHIELEITESLLFENITYITEIASQITSEGFSISIDDFGTGYSSLQYLKKISYDTLKIDMSFVSGIGHDKDDEQLVRTIILLAKQFGMHIVAEGVENAAQVAFLRLLGCNYGQGYYYSKPLEFAEFISWLRQNA